MKSGVWGAWYLDAERLDALVEQGLADEDACEQLLLVHGDAASPSDTQLPALTHAAHIAIEGARFTVACDSLRPAFASGGGFYEHLDGIHGLLRDRRGVHLSLDGDGSAEIWCDSSGRLVLVDLK